MKKLLLILILYQSSLIHCFAQQPNLDSLWGVWNDKTQPDTNRMKAMHEISWDGYLFSKPDSAFYFAQLLYDFSEKVGHKKKMAGALNTQGASFWVRGNYPKALEYFKRSFAINEEIGNLPDAAACLNNMGIIYRSQGDNLKSLDYFLKSLKIREDLGDRDGLPNVLNNIGLIYQDLEDYPKALEYYQKSYDIRVELGQRDKMGGALNNIGLIYQINGDYDQALDYFQRSLAINEEIGDEKVKATSYFNISLNFKKQGDYEKALKNVQNSLAISTKLGDKVGIASALISTGTLNYEMNDYSKSIAACSKGLRIAEDIGDALMQRDACKCLFAGYKALGDGNNALVFHEKMMELDNNLQKSETAKKLQDMEFQKQMLQDSIAAAEKERLIELAHEKEVEEKTQTRNLLLGVGVLTLILAIGLYSRLQFVRKSKATLQVEKDRSENLLLNILPAEIAAELKEKGKADARDFETVSILFTDFKGFTEQSAKLSAAELVNEINHCFEAFDGIIEKHGIEKIKTIGDAYMAAGGLPVPTNDSVKNTVLAALEMQEFISKRKTEMDAAGKPAFEMRVGIHTGPVVAGIVGVKKFQYDIWGDTVNTANRMETNGQAGKVNISQATYELLKNDPQFTFEGRGKIEAKGKGVMEMWFVFENKKIA